MKTDYYIGFCSLCRKDVRVPEKDVQTEHGTFGKAWGTFIVCPECHFSISVVNETWMDDNDEK